MTEIPLHYLLTDVECIMVPPTRRPKYMNKYAFTGIRFYTTFNAHSMLYNKVRGMGTMYTKKLYV